MAQLCAACGSPDVMRAAWVGWDLHSQSWILGELVDFAYCHRCESETRLDEARVGPERWM